MKSKKDKWEKILQDWENSELIRAEYCRRKPIPVSTFDYWRQRIRKDSEDFKPESRLVKIPLAVKHVKRPPIVLEFPSGHKIHIPSDYSFEEITGLLTIFREVF